MHIAGDTFYNAYSTYITAQELYIYIYQVLRKTVFTQYVYIYVCVKSSYVYI